MAHTLIEPGSPEWLESISPSKVAAIAGKSRYESPYSLWHRMKGFIDPEEPRDEFATGHAWELSARELWKLDGRNHGWRIGTAGRQYVVPRHVFGFPALVTLDRMASRGTWRRNVQIKTTGSLEDWGDEYTDEAPADYLIQVLMEMGFVAAATGNDTWTRNEGHLFVLGPRIRQRHLYVVPWRQGVFDNLVDRCRDFYASLQQDAPPPLDTHKATYECVRYLHPDITRGASVKIPHGLVTEYRAANQAVKDDTEWLRGLKTRVLDVMGNAQYAQVGDTTVADRRNHASGSVALVVNNKPFVHPGTEASEPEGKSA